MKMKAQIKQQNSGAAQRPLGSWLASQLGEKDVEGLGRDRGFMSRLTIVMMVMMMVMRRMMRGGIMLMMGRKRKMVMLMVMRTWRGWGETEALG